jgi:aspartyl protease family protein
MVRGLAILFLLGAAVYAVPAINNFVSDPTVRSSFQRERSEETMAYADNPRTVRLRADFRGHFIVNASINGRSIKMLADTGASAVALTEDDARRAGLDPRTLKYDVSVQTANGKVMVASVVLDRIDVKGIVVRDVHAMVSQDDSLSSSLLGMTFLNRLASVKISGDTLELVE